LICGLRNDAEMSFSLYPVLHRVTFRIHINVIREYYSW